MRRRIDVVVAEGRQGRQAEHRTHPLAVGVGRAVVPPGIELAAWAGALRVDAAVHVGRSDFAAQGNAPAPAVFRAFHGGPQRPYLNHQFGWYHPPAVFVGNFAAVERHPEVGAAGATAEAGILWCGIVGGRLACKGNGMPFGGVEGKVTHDRA